MHQNILAPQSPKTHRGRWLDGPPLARVNAVNVLTVLLEAGCDPSLSASAQWSALHEAAFSGYATAVQLLAQHINIEVHDADGFTPLYWACLEGHLLTVQALLRLGANPNALGQEKFRPAHAAAMEVR